MVGEIEKLPHRVTILMGPSAASIGRRKLALKSQCCAAAYTVQAGMARAIGLPWNGWNAPNTLRHLPQREMPDPKCRSAVSLFQEDLPSLSRF